jgi:copper ion binding protein
MLDHQTRRPSRFRVALLWISLVAVATGMSACSRGLSDLKAQASSTPQVQTISIPVEGMSCVSCAARVKRALKGIDGVQHVEVSLERREAVVRFSTEKVTSERLGSAINALGYKAGQSRVVESK